MTFYTLDLQFRLKKAQKKKRRWRLSKKKKTEEKQSSADIIISVDGKGTVFPWNWNYKRNCLNKDIKERKFLKNLINLIETNHQINMSLDHSVSSNNMFKSHFNDKSSYTKRVV